MSAGTLSNAYITDAQIAYADWHTNPTGTFGINHAGQYPVSVASDADRERRLRAALKLPLPSVNMAMTHMSGTTIHTCAVLSVGGGVQCWGYNASGQLGNGTTTDSSTPVQVTGLTSGATAVVVGDTHSCALLSTGTVQCWGGGAYVGNTGMPSIQATPVQVSGLSGVVAIASGGGYHTCALLNTGAVKYWGDNGRGQLGNGTTTASTTPAQVSGLTSGVTGIGVGEYHSCALLNTGAVKCWGDNMNGQLATGSYNSNPNPTPVASLLTSGVATLAAGNGHNCALLWNGSAKCWGSGNHGQLGQGSTSSSPSPVQVSGLIGATSLAIGDHHTCAVLSTGAVQCWGMNNSGQLNDGTTTDRTVPTATLFPAATAVTAGYMTSCVRTTAGAIQCVGTNPISTSATNGALVASQGSVLVRKFPTASGTVTGHVTPIAYTMVNTATGNQALMVTYDPLSAAAAMFIEEYQAHVDACNATTSESITEAQQQTGAALWACSNTNAKSAYLSGLQSLLKGAKMYLFGRTDGSATAPCSGTTTPSYCIDTTQEHLPYTFVVPHYTTSAYNGDPNTTTGTGAYYYTPLSNALATYRSGVFASDASALHKSLQLAGIATFEADYSAIVTTRVQRSGVYGTACVTP